MKTITLEEHFASPHYMDGPGKPMKEQLSKLEGNPMQRVPEQLVDLGEKRIAEMDAAGITMQVLSLNAPGVEQMDANEAVSMAKETNDFLLSGINNHPERFAGFAALPMANAKAAVAELERCMKETGFKGAVINGHIRGKYLDDQSFWPVLECAEALNAPIYLHPTMPPAQVQEAYYSGFSPMVSNMLAMAGWGWHIETAVHIIRLVLGGTFDRFPNLQFIIGHMGEGLPFMMERMNKVLRPEVTKLQRSMNEYLRENVYYTFSGFNYIQNFINLLMEVGTDRIMFSADYPYAPMKEATTFLEQLPVSSKDRERIAYGNATTLLQL